MKKVAILGASGFIGKNLMLNLPKDWKTFAFFNTSVDFPRWAEKYKISESTVFVQQDLSKEFNYPYPELLPKHFDMVISLIGDTRKLDKKLLPMQNFNSDSMALIGFFNKFSCDNLLYFSSGCVYEGHTGIVCHQKTKDIQPFTAYAIAKRTSEMLLNYFIKEKKVKHYLNVRFFGAYGPHQRDEKITTKLIKLFTIDKKKGAELFGTGNNLFDAMYVQDCIDWILLAVNQKFNNNTVDFGKAMPISIGELALCIAEVCGVKDSKIKFNAKIAPKENYHFRLGDSWFRPPIPFKYKFKIEFKDGLTLLKNWLIKEGR